MNPPHHRRTRTAGLALLLAGATVLAACGSKSSDNGSGPSSPTASVDIGKLGSAGAGMDPTAKGPVTIPGATKGGTVTVLSYAGLDTIDPTNAYETTTGSILSGLITRSLTQYKYDPAKKDMVLVPDLATDLGTPNKDFTSWSFTIRKGVKWAENGKEVTPQDVAYGIERSFDRKTFNQGADYSNEYFLDGDTYKGPFQDKKPYAGLTIKGQTITIKMSRPFPDMPYWAAFPAMGPIPKGHDNPATYYKHPWSTGPYMVKSQDPEKSLVLVKNPNWDPATDPGRTQYPDEYDFNVQTPSNKIDAIMATAKNGGATTLSYDNILAGDYRTFDQSRLVTGGSPCTAYWAFDMRKIKDIRIRQAIAYAYPYKAASIAAGGIDGVTVIRGEGQNIMPPGVPGREQYTVNDGLPGDTDAAKAKQLLTEAGALGYTLKWPYLSDDPIAQQTVKIRSAAFKAAGFNPQPVATTVGQYTDFEDDPKSDINLRPYGWCSDWPSGASWFPPLMQSTKVDTEGLGQNQSAFSEPTVDAQMKKIPTLSLTDQPAAWNTLDQDITKNYLPIMNLYYIGVAMMRGADINGMNDDDVFGAPTWKDIWVSQ